MTNDVNQTVLDALIFAREGGSFPKELNPDTRLTRKQLSAALTFAGYPVCGGTLATMVTTGGGPPMERFGRKPMYRWGDALAWAQGRTTLVRPRQRAGLR